MQLQNFFEPVENKQDKPTPGAKLEGDALEQLWRPNIKRERMHSTGEVRIKYDSYNAKNTDEIVDEEFLQEYGDGFTEIKTEQMMKSEIENERILAKIENRAKSEPIDPEFSTYKGIKLELTKEEQAHADFVKKAEHELKLKQEENDIENFMEKYEGCVELRSEFQSDDEDVVQVTDGHKVKAIDSMFKSKALENSKNQTKKKISMNQIKKPLISRKKTILTSEKRVKERNR